jgi:Fe-Mn family superoxide dismutase
MPFQLPKLPYAANALEPTIDARTMEIHHGKHHATYVTKLNEALEGTPDLAGESIESVCAKIHTLPEALQGAVRNNGGGHYNHSLFWTVMAPGGGGEPSGTLASAITEAFKSFGDFQKAFAQAATTRFGSGWAWLYVKADGRLGVCSTANQDNPLMTGIVPDQGTPILGLDVWEHAYYLHYQNRRPDYINAWWDVVNWSAVQDRFNAARSS